jgi:hypothetical protein
MPKQNGIHTRVFVALCCMRFSVSGRKTRTGILRYIRVLACNDAGKAVLREARKKATLPIVMKTADIRKLDERAQRVFASECAATDIFVLALPNPLPCGTEQIANAIIKK